jgi:hypothetical protein
MDLGLPQDENIPDGEQWVCNYSRTSLSNGFFKSLAKAWRP